MLAQQLVGQAPVGVVPVRLDQQHGQLEQEDGQDGRQDGPELVDLPVLYPSGDQEKDQGGNQEGKQERNQGESSIGKDIEAIPGMGVLRLLRDGVQVIP